MAWEYLGVVLAEPFHLSYPQVIESSHAVYLVPEAAESGSVLAYRATDFPTGWARPVPLISGSLGRGMLDPTIFRHASRWWMFGCTGSAEDELRLFTSADLVGAWTEHPASPVVTGGSAVRPAGPVLRHDGRLIRLAQDAYPAYGSRVMAFEIVTLTGTEYRERQLSAPVVAGSGSGWHAAAMHHVDAHRLADDSWLAFVDGSD
jgi:hypothetical protein